VLQLSAVCQLDNLKILLDFDEILWMGWTLSMVRGGTGLALVAIWSDIYGGFLIRIQDFLPSGSMI